MHLFTLDSFLSSQIPDVSELPLSISRPAFISGSEITFEELLPAQQMLIKSGRWDIVTGIGVQNCLYLPVKELPTPCIKPKDRKMAEVSIEAHERMVEKRWILVLQRNVTTQHRVLDAAVRTHTPIIAQHLNESEGYHPSLASIAMVGAYVAGNTFTSAGYAYVSIFEICESLRLSHNTVRNSLKVLGDSGLYGIIKGRGHQKSRIYSLSIEAGLEAYKELFDI